MNQKLQFKPITLSAKNDILPFALNSEIQNCDFSFANICVWHFLYKSEYAIVNDYIIIRFHSENHIMYMMPVGQGDIREVMKAIEADAQQLGVPLLIAGVTIAFEEALKSLYGDEFRFIDDRAHYDYIYLRENLVTLSGKKFQSKRNHINHFEENYAYTFEPLSPELVPKCLELEKEWCKRNNCSDSTNLENERKALTYALSHYEELGIIGGAILIDGKVAAFTYGAPINANTFDILVEKADVDYDGIYAIINKCFASYIPDNYIYINREEDLGVEGLRKAKLSYHPVILLEKKLAIKYNSWKKS